MKEPTYVGDGVYVRHDGFQIWVMTDGEGFTKEIALEPNVLKTLLEKVKDLPGYRWITLDR